MSQTTVDQIINSHLKKIKSKKKRKKLQKELILVGIHVRYDFKKYKSKIICTGSSRLMGISSPQISLLPLFKTITKIWVMRFYGLFILLLRT